ncbi:3-hydroxyacyl-CoA dehydrogenase family protein [Salinibacterium hongtaonis]|nr:3-hydroxyacyl-CoA dehydrogenase family protein [Salinibacterium hongtaonis]
MNIDTTRVAIVGAGYMGGGIGQTLARGGATVVLLDRDPAAAEAGHRRVVEQAADFEEKGYFDKGDAGAIAARISWSGDIAASVASADLIFEVVFEDLEVKKPVLLEIEKHARPDAIIASNTSAIPIAAMAEVLSTPERFFGIHFFNPAQLLPGVEVIPGEKSDRSLIPGILELLTAAGKEPAVVPDTPGFVCNRLQFALYKEAVKMVEEGAVSPEQIDTVVKASFGFRLALYGPFQVGDMAGLDVYASSYKSLEAELGERYTVPDSLRERVESGDFGIKTGGGYLGLSEDEAARLIAGRDKAYVALGALRRELAADS